MKDVERVLELDKRATAGPWEATSGNVSCHDGEADRLEIRGPEFKSHVTGNTIRTFVCAGHYAEPMFDGDTNHPEWVANNELIAEYRTLAPRLASDLALAMQVVEAAKVVKDEFEETLLGAEYDGSHKKAIDALITALAALEGKKL